MSYDGDTNTVLKGVTHGAVDFLIKPVRLEELRNMWQHVVRKRKQQCGDPEGHAETGVKQQQSSSHSSGDAGAEARARRVHEVGPSHAGGSGAGEARKRPHDDHDKPLRPNGKRPRVHWSSEMHSQFVAAVNKLGIDKAVPKKILELMSVEGLTRENVASHLQKYRLYLKKAARMDGTGRPPPGMPGVGGPAPPGQAQPGASHGPPAPPDQQFPPFMGAVRLVTRVVKAAGAIVTYAQARVSYLFRNVCVYMCIWGCSSDLHVGDVQRHKAASCYKGCQACSTWPRHP